MASLIEYALLADRPYIDIRHVSENVPVLPPGWNPVLGSLPIADPCRPGHYGGPVPETTSGFSADVFQKGNEIVISFAGTNADPLSADGLADWNANGILGGETVGRQRVRVCSSEGEIGRAHV